MTREAHQQSFDSDLAPSPRSDEYLGEASNGDALSNVELRGVNLPLVAYLDAFFAFGKHPSARARRNGSLQSLSSLIWAHCWPSGSRGGTLRHHLAILTIPADVRRRRIPRPARSQATDKRENLTRASVIANVDLQSQCQIGSSDQ